MTTDSIRDVCLYGTLGALTALAGSPDPVTWRTGVAVFLSGLLAVKAKMSTGVGQATPVVALVSPDPKAEIGLK